MEVRVYNGEHFDRPKSWFVWFAVVLAAVIGASLFFANLFGSIILFLFTWAYILFSLTKNKHIALTVRDTGLVVDTRLRPRQWLDSFVVEIDAQSQEWKHIVIVMKNNEHMIFSFDDSHENKQAFIGDLENHIPLIETYPQTTMDKIVRRLKL